MDRDYIDDWYIQADYGYIYLKMDKVFGFPEDTFFWGGYDTLSRIEIKSGNYSVKGQVYISTANLYDFYQELEKCYRTLKGIATLKSYEENLFMTLKFDAYGHVEIAGTFKEYNSTANKLDFEMTTDQTFLKEAVEALKRIHNTYGDYKGVIRQ